MRINLNGLGKRYNLEWIFRNLSFQFEFDRKYAITGPNGSGKSTLLQIIGGSVTHNEGRISYEENGSPVSHDYVHKNISFSAPYLELVEEMTLSEFFSFHQKMKGFLMSVGQKEIIAEINLENAKHKQIRYFSSGMKQRVKLAQAIFSDVSTILLDEPLTNLDKEGAVMYHSLIKKYCHDRLVIVSSNDQSEYTFCDKIINLPDFK
jgi:ABC-type multidrug transport system ATPase subunit